MKTNNFNQIVIWGHKLYSHTHSYIHYGFFKGFKHLNYKCLWLDNDDNIENIDFTNSLFITEGQVDEKIPLKDDCLYIIHNCNKDKYNNVKTVCLQVFTMDCLKYNAKMIPNEYGFYIDDCIFICWATDLLPNEIDNNINNINNNNNNNIKELNFIGNPTQPWDKVNLFCQENNIIYKHYGGFSTNKKSPKENMELIQKSILAPSIQDSWQVENGYIPCRIFKNISYGKMGLTNNIIVQNLFNDNLLYDNDINNLLHKGLEFNNKNLLVNLMEEVKQKHTYINRINALFWYIDNILK